MDLLLYFGFALLLIYVIYLHRRFSQYELTIDKATVQLENVKTSIENIRHRMMAMENGENLSYNEYKAIRVWVGDLQKQINDLLGLETYDVPDDYDEIPPNNYGLDDLAQQTIEEMIERDRSQRSST